MSHLSLPRRLQPLDFLTMLLPFTLQITITTSREEPQLKKSRFQISRFSRFSRFQDFRISRFQDCITSFSFSIIIFSISFSFSSLALLNSLSLSPCTLTSSLSLSSLSRRAVSASLRSSTSRLSFAISSSLSLSFH